jgi:RHS repeat-associated protein
VPLDELFLELDGKNETARSKTELEYFSTPNDPLRHGLLRKQVVTQQGKSTRHEFAYILKAETLELQTSQIGFDGTLRTSLRTVSALNGVTKSERNEDGGTVVFQHDSLGRLLSETVAPGAAYAATQSTSYALANGSVTPSRTLSTDVNGLRQQVTYDGLGRTIRIEEQDADNQVGGPLRTVYSARYNAVGQLIEETRTDWMQGVPLAQKTDFVFDGWGQVKTTQHSDGRKEHIEFDPVTLREARWQEGMGKTVTVHNLFGKPQSVEAFDIKGVSLGKTLNEYDGMGRSVSQTDPVGNKTVFQYDVFNRLQRSILPDGHTVETEYAAHSQDQLPVEVKVAGRSLGQQTFDGLGRLIQSKVGGRVTTAGYEAGFSTPAWEQMPGGKVEYRYERSLGGRVTHRSTTGLLASYTYHPKLGLPTQCIEGGRKSDFEYYPSGRLKAETSTLGAREEKALYTYSLGGRPLTCTDVFGHQHETTYDQHGRPKSFEQNALKATFAYNALGQLATVNAQDTAGQSSLVTRLTYDDLGRETSRIFEVAGAGTQTLTSSYTLASKLARKTLKSGNITLRDELFSYDKRGRLVQYTCSGTQRPRDPHGKEILKQTYVFDAMDNIVTLETEFPGGKNITSYDYSSIDPTQLTGIRHSHKDYPAPITLQYDASGQLIKDEQARRLTYDALGRLTQVADAVGAVVRGYHYDAQDRLVELSQPSGPLTQRYYCEGRVLNETRGQDKRTCLRIGDTLLGQHQRQGQRDETKLVGVDQQRSVLTEVSSAQRRDVAYSPYGHRPAEGGLFSLLGFSGEQLDPLTGLYLLGNGTRAYSPTLMRFLSPDTMSPFGAGGLNPYAYCAGDPINRVDPTGHFWQALLGIGLAIAGFALSVVTMGAATTLAAIGIALAGTSATLGIAGIIADEVAPESGIGKIFGWASLATGLLSAGTGLAALGKSAAQWGNKLAGAYRQGLSGNAKDAAKAMAGGLKKGKAAKQVAMPKGKGAIKNAKAAAKADGEPSAPGKWTRTGVGDDSIPVDMKRAQRGEWEAFRDGLDEGLHPKTASERMGDPKLTKLRGGSDQWEVRIGGGERVSFFVDNKNKIVNIKQIGGHT